MKVKIHTDKAPAAIGPYSQAIDAGPLVFLSGQIPFVQAWKNLDRNRRRRGEGLGMQELNE